MDDLLAARGVLLVAIAYAIGMLWIAYYSAFPARDWLLERIEHLKIRKDFADNKTLALLEQTGSSLKKWWQIRASFIQACWRLVHGIEDEHVMDMRDGEVHVALESVRDKLRLLEAEEAELLADRIDEALKDEATTIEHRALLRDAQTYRHNISDSAYEELAKLMTKAIWLALVGLVAIVILAEVENREIYFLLGAAGGLMSRLMRIMKEQPAATDYGAAWSTLILSPVSGALAGWIGIALVAALGSEPISFINSRVPPLVWDQSDHVLGLGLAFLLGFSERLFSGVVEASEERFTALATKKPAKDEQKRTHKTRRKRGNR